MRALANSVCLLAFSRSDRHVLSLLLCTGLIVLCCAVLCFACRTAAVDARQHSRTYGRADGAVLHGLDACLVSNLVNSYSMIRENKCCDLSRVSRHLLKFQPPEPAAPWVALPGKSGKSGHASSELGAGTRAPQRS